MYAGFLMQEFRVIDQMQSYDHRSMLSSINCCFDGPIESPVVFGCRNVKDPSSKELSLAIRSH